MTTPGDDRQALADDYAALRHGCGAVQLERDVVEVAGPEAEAYLQGQLSQDVSGLAVGSAGDALLLEPDGKLCALLRVTRLGESRFVLDTDAGAGEAVAARLARFRLRTKVDLEPVAWPVVAVRGADAASAVAVPEGRAGGDGPWVVAVEWNGVHGLDLLGPGAEAAVGPSARWCGAPAWEALRIEAGIPAMGRELDAKTIAAEAGLVERAVSFAKGCYTGQELVARLDARGNRVARHLRGLVAGDEAEESGGDRVTLVAGEELFHPESGKAVGRCTSAAWCPGLGRVAGLGYVHRSVDVPGSVATGSPDGPRVEVRALPLFG